MSLQKKKTSPYWYAVIYMDGKHQWISTKCEKKLDAQAVHDEIKIRFDNKKRARRIAALLGETLPGDNSIPVKEAWKNYTMLKPDGSRASKKYFSPFREWLKVNHPECILVGQINKPVAVEFLYNNYGEKAPKTFNNVKSALSTIWKTLQIKCDIDNPWKIIPNREPDSQRYRAFADGEIIKILKKSKGFWHDAVLIALYTGLRRKDITFLQREQIKSDFIELYPSKTKRHARAVYIPIHKELKKLLKKYESQSDYLFPDMVRQYDTGVYNEAFGKILSAADIHDNKNGKASFHSLRSTFVTRCEENGIDIKVIQGIVGHNSPSMTRHYSEDKISARQILKLPSVL